MEKLSLKQCMDKWLESEPICTVELDEFGTVLALEKSVHYSSDDIQGEKYNIARFFDSPIGYQCSMDKYEVSLSDAMTNWNETLVEYLKG